MELTHVSEVRALLSRHGFTFSKSLGQHFLIHPHIAPRMAENAVISATCGVLEIGPGIGVLTKELALRAQKVVAVELDRRLLPVLQETLSAFGHIRIIEGDVLKIDLAALIEEHFAGMDVTVCANLPYYITSPVIMRLLESRLPVKTVTVMVQKEAADRLCAKVGTRLSGAVTVAVAYYAEADVIMRVSRGSFLPPPNVDSAVIQLKIRKNPPVKVVSEAAFFQTVKAAFGQRRKTIINSLSNGLGVSKEKIRETLSAAGIAETRRAETLTLCDFAALANEKFL